MTLDRRQLIASSGIVLASCAARTGNGTNRQTRPLDSVLEAHAGALPEVDGSVNHYPMAAEVLEAMGHPEGIGEAWRNGAAYAGELVRVAPISSPEDADAALGDFGRYADWLDFFEAELADDSWRTVVARWAPVLAPGIVAAVYHGVIRTGHAVRALRTADTPARRRELAIGLAYWAARYTELPIDPKLDASLDLRSTLTGLEHPWIDDHAPVPLENVVPRLVERPLAPALATARAGATPREELDLVIEEATCGVLEMLVLERNRVWLMHTITGPAAIGFLLPDLDDATAHSLVAYARQSVVAMYAGLGEPFEARAHERSELPSWSSIVERAAASDSVHTIKLADALQRFEREGDPLYRSVLAQWFEWT